MASKTVVHPCAIIEPGSLVFDIGANTGYMTELWISAGAGQMVCVEPCLKNFIELSKRPGLTPIHAAAWSHEKIIPISFCNNQPGLSTCDPGRWGPLFPEARYDPPEYVPAITLNSLANLFGVPYFVKVDVEGSERDVIMAMKFKPNYLIFEYHKDYRDECHDILIHLHNLGFTKAVGLDGELNIDLVPNIPILEFAQRWKRGGFGLGNITVT
jgi:FkbM family methyltransferase